MKKVVIVAVLFIQKVYGSNVIQLVKGHQHLISAPGVSRVSIGDPAIADIKVLSRENQVMVTGLGNGSTDLLLWLKGGEKKSFLIRVGASSHTFLAEVKKNLQDIEGIQLQQVGDRLYLKGEIFRGDDLSRIQKALEKYPRMINQTRFNPKALGYFANVISQELQKSGLQNIEVTPQQNSIFLEGEVSQKLEIQKALIIATAIFPKIVNQLSSGIQKEELILVDLKFVEIRKDSLFDIGVRWPDKIEVTGSSSFSNGSQTFSTTIGKDAAASIGALLQKGLAKILSNPKLLCRNGMEASFFAGGEVPIRLTSERSANVLFKPYGLSIVVKAQVDRSRRIFMEINAKMSDIDSATAHDGIPGILEHNLKTALTLDLEETVVLAGLLENRSSKNVRKIPFLGHIPILGELFKSRSFARNESEFFIFLTPMVGRSRSPIHQEISAKNEQNIKKITEEIEFSLLD